jgi:hypothetical protein
VNDLLALGALAFFAKPFRLAEVVRVLGELLAGATQPDDSRPPS